MNQNKNQIRTPLSETKRTKYLMNVLWMFFFASVLLVEAEATSLSKTFIYYTTFQVETYEPITSKTIKEKAKYRFEITDTNSASVLLNLLSKGEKASEFDEKRVRLLVVWNEGKQRVTVDTTGHILNGEERRSLGAQDFERLKSLLSSLIKSAP